MTEKEWTILMIIIIVYIYIKQVMHNANAHHILKNDVAS